MYSSPAKSRITALVSSVVARANASMSTGSLADVISPVISTTATPSPAGRTSIVIVSRCILVLLRVRSRAGRPRHRLVLVREDRHEVRQPGDLEDLPVVPGQAAGDEL